MCSNSDDDDDNCQWARVDDVARDLMLNKGLTRQDPKFINGTNNWEKNKQLSTDFEQLYRIEFP